MLKPEPITQLPLDILLLDPGHPRQLIDPQSLARLSTDISTHGILQPLIVRLKPYNPDLPCAPPPEYIIVNGGRRFRAAQLAGFETVPCLIRDLSEREALEWQLAEPDSSYFQLGSRYPLQQCQRRHSSASSAPAPRE